MLASDYTHDIEVLHQKIAVHENKLNRLTEEKNILHLKIQTLADLNGRLVKTDAELSKLERFIRKKDPGATLLDNPHYQSLSVEKQKILAIIKTSPVTENSEKELLLLKGRILSVQEILSELKSHLSNKETEYRKFAEAVVEEAEAIEPSISSHTYAIQWKDVTFGNETVCIKLGGKSLAPLAFPGSSTSLNPCKEVYSFRGVPNLLLQLNGDGSWHIENIEVLKYIVHFLGLAGRFTSSELAGNSKSTFSVTPYKKLDKSFYKTQLPEMFTPYYFSFLWEHAVEDIPIIPVPETVVTSAGTTEIQESFLFPLINGTSAIIWILESAEESKASLLFRTSKENLCEDLQQVFDYLVGEGSNKRSELIKNKALAKQLGLRKRITHKDQREWRVEVKGVLRYAEYPALL